MQIVPLPPPDQLEKLLGGLLMRAVKVARAEGEPDGPLAAAVFGATAPDQRVLLVCDLPLAAGLAAGLSVVPMTVVKECVAAGRLDEGLADNFAEVMNVVSRFVSGAGQAFRLGTVSLPPSPVDEALRAAADETDEKRSFTVEVPGYGGGRLAFWTL
jgi:hypothetical protein